MGLQESNLGKLHARQALYWLIVAGPSGTIFKMSWLSLTCHPSVSGFVPETSRTHPSVYMLLARGLLPVLQNLVK